MATPEQFYARMREKLREPTTGRLRASIRGTVPALATVVALLFASIAILPTIGEFLDTETYIGATIGMVIEWSLFVVLVAIGLWLAIRLDRGSLARFGLDVDRRWLENFVIGVAISLVSVVVAVGYGIVRGFFSLNAEEAAGYGDVAPLVVVATTGGFLVFFLVQNVYEELIYRSVMLQNFAEGLYTRGYSASWAIVGAVVGSSILFGAYHVPLRGPVVGLDSILVGIVFALAYLITGRLGLVIGVHFGRFPLELMRGLEFGPGELPSVVETADPTLLGSLEISAVQLGVTVLLIVVVAFVRYGEVRIADRIYESRTAGSAPSD